MTYEECLRDLSTRRDDLVVMTAENRAAIRGLPPFLKGRFIDVGIAEQTMIGAAAGLALRGRTPVVHALATFLTLRAFEFVRTDVGIGNLPVKMVGGVPGFLSEANGPTHQALEDVALMRGIPNMQVFCPADREELADALPQIIESRAPAYIRYIDSAPSVKHGIGFEIGKAETLSEGTDISLLAYGFLLREAVKTKEILESRGLSVRLINLRSLKPIDQHTVVKALEETRMAVTIEDHFLTGGLYSIIGEICLARNLSPTVLPIALRDRWFKPALLEDVLTHEGFSAEQLADTIIDAFKRSQGRKSRN